MPNYHLYQMGLIALAAVAAAAAVVVADYFGISVADAFADTDYLRVHNSY